MEVFGLGIKIQEQGAATVEAAIKRLGGELTRTVLSVAAVTKAMQLFVRETSDQQREQAQLTSALRSTNHVSGQNITILNSQAEALREVTAFTGGAIAETQALLLTFTNIREVFPDATRLALDMAQALGMDARSAAMMLGKALNDPILGVTALRRAGVQLSDAQQKLVKDLVASNKTLEAQRVILKELQTQVGGSAAAYRNTLGGAVDSAKESFLELFELQEKQAPKLEAIANFFDRVFRGLKKVVFDTPEEELAALDRIITNARLIKPEEEFFLGKPEEVIANAQARINEILAQAREQAKINAASRDRDTQKAIELTEEQIKVEQERLAQLIEFNSLLPRQQRDLEALASVERILERELKQSNTSLERKTELLRQLNQVRTVLYEVDTVALKLTRTFTMLANKLGETKFAFAPTTINANAIKEAMKVSLSGIQAKPLQMPLVFDPQESIARMRLGFQDYAAAVQEEAARLKTSVGDVLMRDLGVGLANALENGLAQGLEAAIMSGRISDLWKVLAQSFVSQIASMMVKVALTYIGFAQMIASIQKFLIANPLAAVAAAAAMLAFAYANGGKAQTGQNTVAGGANGLQTGMAVGNLPVQQIIFGATSATTAAGMQPRQAMNVTIIGPNDPQAQRSMQELLNKANSRGKIG